jgi:hypothetical protein
MNILIGVYPLGIVIYKFLPIFRQKNWHVGKHYMYGVLISMICGMPMLAPQFVYMAISLSFMVYGIYPIGAFYYHRFQIYPLFIWRLLACYGGHQRFSWQSLAVFGLHQTTLAGVLFLLTTIIFISYNAGIPDWDGSGGFGFRRIISLVPFLPLGLQPSFTPYNAGAYYQQSVPS